MLPTIISIAFSPRLKRVRVKTRYIYRKLQCYLIHKWTKPIESTKQLHCLQSIRLLTAIKFVVVFFSFGAAMRNVCYLFGMCVCVACFFFMSHSILIISMIIVIERVAFPELCIKFFANKSNSKQTVWLWESPHHLLKFSWGNFHFFSLINYLLWSNDKTSE